MRFRSDGNGRWISDDGRYGIFHVMAGTQAEGWELVEILSSDPGDWQWLDTAWSFGEIVQRLERKRIVLPSTVHEKGDADV